MVKFEKYLGSIRHLPALKKKKTNNAKASQCEKEGYMVCIYF